MPIQCQDLSPRRAGLSLHLAARHRRRHRRAASAGGEDAMWTASGLGGGSCKKSGKLTARWVKRWERSTGSKSIVGSRVNGAKSGARLVRNFAPRLAPLDETWTHAGTVKRVFVRHWCYTGTVNRHWSGVTRILHTYNTITALVLRWFYATTGQIVL